MIIRDKDGKIIETRTTIAGPTIPDTESWVREIQNSNLEKSLNSQGYSLRKIKIQLTPYETEEGQGSQINSYSNWDTCDSSYGNLDIDPDGSEGVTKDVFDFSVQGETDHFINLMRPSTQNGNSSDRGIVILQVRYMLNSFGSRIGAIVWHRKPFENPSKGPQGRPVVNL